MCVSLSLSLSPSLRLSLCKDGGRTRAISGLLPVRAEQSPPKRRQELSAEPGTSRESGSNGMWSVLRVRGFWGEQSGEGVERELWSQNPRVRYGVSVTRNGSLPSRRGTNGCTQGMSQLWAAERKGRNKVVTGEEQRSVSKFRRESRCARRDLPRDAVRQTGRSRNGQWGSAGAGAGQAAFGACEKTHRKLTKSSALVINQPCRRHVSKDPRLEPGCWSARGHC